MIVQTAPSIRAAIGEGFGYEPGTPVTGKMVSALRLMGFHKIFDTNFGADLTIVEEAHEFVRRLEKNERLPLITSCSPGWIKFLEHFYPELIPLASTCRSSMSMLSVLAKTYYAEKEGLDPRKIFNVAVMPCTAKKYEACRPEHYAPWGAPWTDAVVTTREIIWMIKSLGIEFRKLGDAYFDTPLGMSTGAGDIFGTTGGVMEAALRAAHEKLTGQTCEQLDFVEVRGVEVVKESRVQLGDRVLNVAVADELQNAKRLLDQIVSGKKTYHTVEIMACPGGGIGGGGQPYPPPRMHIMDAKLLRMRAKALYSIDLQKQFRKSHENSYIRKLVRALSRRTPQPQGARIAAYALSTPRTARYTMSATTTTNAPTSPVLPEHIVQFIESVQSDPHRESYLIAVLQMEQQHFGYPPTSWMDEVSQRLGVPAARVAGVATFYYFFTFTPKGKHRISVCLGTACHVKGAQTLIERLQNMLQVKPGSATADGLFSLESARSVGACALAPVMIVDDKVYANVRPDELPKTFRNMVSKQNQKRYRRNNIVRSDRRKNGE